MKKSIKSFGLSFLHAFKGIFWGIRSGRNLRLQFTAAFYCFLLAPLFLKSRVEWVVVILVIFLVLALELLNTSVEYICDTIDSGYNKNIGVTKDLASGAVFMISIAAAIIGAILFLDKAGFARFFEFCRNNIWYPIVLVIMLLPAFLFIKGKRVKWLKRK